MHRVLVVALVLFCAAGCGDEEERSDPVENAGAWCCMDAFEACRAQTPASEGECLEIPCGDGAGNVCVRPGAESFCIWAGFHELDDGTTCRAVSGWRRHKQGGWSNDQQSCRPLDAPSPACLE